MRARAQSAKKSAASFTSGTSHACYVSTHKALAERERDLPTYLIASLVARSKIRACTESTVHLSLTWQPAKFRNAMLTSRSFRHTASTLKHTARTNTRRHEKRILKLCALHGVGSTCSITKFSGAAAFVDLIQMSFTGFVCEPASVIWMTSLANALAGAAKILSMCMFFFNHAQLIYSVGAAIFA